MKSIVTLICVRVCAYKHIYLYLPHANIQKSNTEGHILVAKWNDTSFTAKELFPQV